ncbi:MAG: cation:proton antiporter [Deltaproteobacteria bacterium]|nr:cation:proton antiporter [Deltaproteobacteria bacterium]
MPLLVGMQELLGPIVLISAVVMAVGFLLKIFKQPSVISYIIVGVVLGPSVFGVASGSDDISAVGSLGLVLLLFLVGMEMSLPKLIANWRISVIGTFLQVVISLLVMWGLGVYLGWPVARIVMLGFVLALSSTAVILKLLGDWNEMQTRVGQNVIGVLLTQDVLVIVMLVVMNYLGGTAIETWTVVTQVAGLVAVAVILFIIIKKKHIHLPFEKHIARDNELQVFVALTTCFGFAMLAELAHLSAALGSFIGGIIVSSTASTKWIQKSLHAFQVIFVSTFFVYVGMIIDLSFVWENVWLIASLVVSVFVLNTVINTLVFVAFRIPWRQSVYAGALLSQVGEFSFVLGTVGLSQNIIAEYTFQLIISTIALSLFLSPAWIFLNKKLLRCDPFEN